MKYLYHEGNFIEELLKVNNLRESDLDTSSFVVDNKDQSLITFKEKLLTNKTKKFLIVGDYDCDGICSCAIVKRLLEHLNIKHNFYIPSRQKDGYGLNNDIVKMAKENGFEVLLTVDNGIVANEALALASDLDIQVLIIDHHEYEKKPQCTSYIHPNLLKKGYDNLAAGGLAYLLSSLFYEDDFSKVLGGLATLGDMVGVLGFNRYLVKETLRILNEKNIHSINLLNGSNIHDYNSLSFNVIPKINSISRMEYNPNIFVKYLLSDEETCKRSIEQINKINEKRKYQTNKLCKDVTNYIIRNDNVVLAISEEFNVGLCGLIANRLIFSLNKPVIVLSKDGGLLKGSCRSKEDFNMFGYLNGTKEIFEAFGGHEMACGITLKEENLVKLLKYIDETNYQNNEVFKDVFCIEENELNYDNYLKLEALKPFGSDFKEPLLVLKNADKTKRSLAANKYLKLNFENGSSAISFNLSHAHKDFKDIIGHLNKDNYYPNKVTFVIEDLC